jgi:ankyrin repeat protein
MVAAVLSQQEHDRQLALSALMWLSQYDGSLSTEILLEIVSRTGFSPGRNAVLSCQELVDCCRGLVVVVDSDDLRFVHLTFLHYLRDFPILPREQEHILLTKASLAYFLPSTLGTSAEKHILCWLKQVGVISDHLEAVEKSTVGEFKKLLNDGTCTPDSLLPDSLNNLNVWWNFGSPDFSAGGLYSKLQLATLLGRYDYVSRKLPRGSKRAVDKGSPTLLALAAVMPGHVRMMRLLLDRGASPNAVAWEESRPLHWAAMGGNLLAVKLLLEKGALVSAVGTRENTALHLATLKNDMKLVKVLVAHHADVAAQGNGGQTPLHMACFRGYLNLVEFFVIRQGRTWATLRDSSGSTPLHSAAISGQVHVVDRLLNVSTDLTQDEKSRTSLLEAKDCQGRTALVATADELRTGLRLDDLLEVATTLLRHGANPSAFNHNGWTALHDLCAFTSHQKIARRMITVLLEHGADALCKENKGHTPLHVLARQIPPQKDLMTLLLQHDTSGGAGLVSAPDAEGCTPLHHAVMSAECLSLLLDLGASANDVDLLGWTALHWIAFRNDIEADDVESRIDALLNVQARLDAVDASDRTPLDVAFDEWCQMLLYDPQHSYSASKIFWAFHRRGAGFAKKQKKHTLSLCSTRDDSAIRGSMHHAISDWSSGHLRRSKSCDTTRTALKKTQPNTIMEAGELLTSRRREKSGRLQDLLEARNWIEGTGPDYPLMDDGLPLFVDPSSFTKPAPLRCSVTSPLRTAS